MNLLFLIVISITLVFESSLSFCLYAVGADEGEGGYQESEEELQQRLIQLLNLPSAPPSETPLTENTFQPSHLDKV